MELRSNATQSLQRLPDTPTDAKHSFPFLPPFTATPFSKNFKNLDREFSRESRRSNRKKLTGFGDFLPVFPNSHLAIPVPRYFRALLTVPKTSSFLLHL
jgi:hypothetical protein